MEKEFQNVLVTDIWIFTSVRAPTTVVGTRSLVKIIIPVIYII